jgi:Domain of unknown function (DUF4136)
MTTVRVLTAVMALAPFCQMADAGKVRAFSAPNADLSQYKTYQWLPTRALTNTGIVEDDPVLTPLIKEAVNRELTRLGLIEVAGGGDLPVATGLTKHASPQVEAVVLASGAEGMYYATPIATIGRYNRKGSLIVNLIDSKTKTSAWAGIAEEDLSDMKGAGQKKIGKAAVNLFKKYPEKKR